MIFFKVLSICLVFIYHSCGQEMPRLSGNHTESPQILIAWSNGESATACMAAGFCFIKGFLHSQLRVATGRGAPLSGAEVKTCLNPATGLLILKMNHQPYRLALLPYNSEGQLVMNRKAGVKLLPVQMGQ